MRQLIFLILPNVHALDLSGPLQVFFEANGFGADYRLRYCSPQPRVRMAQGLWIDALEPLPEIGPEDTVVIAGIDSSTLDDLDGVPTDWLRAAARAGARLCSICTGAFILAHAGLLDRRECTTHWKIADRLERDYPLVTVIKNRLFVKDGRIITSAGVASGIDTALSLVEDDFDPLMAARVAREIVVYMRRDGGTTQSSIYLNYRTHFNPGVHRVQDWLVNHPERQASIDDLAKEAGMSRRNLTRSFRRATGITLKQFATELKLEVAENLIGDPGQTIENVAAQCGFKDARQLRRLVKANFGINPSAWREGRERRVGRC